MIGTAALPGGAQGAGCSPAGRPAQCGAAAGPGQAPGRHTAETQERYRKDRRSGAAWCRHRAPKENADGHAAGRRLRARVLQSRDREPPGHAGHVRQPGREADEIDVVLRAGVQPDQLVGREPELLGGGRQLEAQLALVAARQLHRARRRQHVRARARPQLAQGPGERVVADDQRIVVDEQGAVRRDRLGHARNSPLLDHPVEGVHALVDLDADLVAELDRDGQVAGRQESRVEIDQVRGPRASRSADP